MTNPGRSAWWHLGALLGVGAAVALYLRATPCPTLIYAHDVPILAEMGSRWLQGQRPHADFYSPFGPVLYALLGLCMRLAGGRAVGIAWAPLVVAVACLTLGVVGSWRRPGAGARCLSLVTVAFVALGVRILNCEPHWLSYATSYNRFGFAALVALQMALLLPFDESAEAAPWWRRPSCLAAGASALLASLLLWTKPTFGAAAVALIAAALAAQPPLRRRAPLVALAAVAALACAACLVAIRGDVGAMLRDLRMAARARSTLWTPGGLLLTLRAGFAGFVAPAAVAAAAAVFGRAPRREGAALVALGLIGGALSFTLAIGNLVAPGRVIEVPLAAPLSLLLLARASRFELRPAATALAVLTAALLTGASLEPDLAAFALAHRLKVDTARRPADYEFPGERWRGLRIVRYDTRCWGRAPAAQVRNAVALLRAARLDAARVVVFDFSDPFTLARGAPSPSGAPPWWHAGVNVTDGVVPAPEFVFRDAEAVMIPGCPDVIESTRLLVRSYGPYLRAHYALVHRDADWAILRRVR